MKLSEITFKVIIGTIQRSETIQQAVFTRGGTLKDGTTEPIAMVPFSFVWNGKYLSWVDFSEYLVHPGIEMTFAQALAAINNCEAPKKDSGEWIELDVEEDGMIHRCKVIGPIIIEWMNKESIATRWNKRFFVVTPETVKKMQCCGNCNYSDEYYHTFCQSGHAHSCRTNTGNSEHEDHWRFAEDEAKAHSETHRSSLPER